jgi:alkanesulfonate monooxygenase
MTIEFIGIAATAPHSETEIAAPSPAGQPGYLEELARAHEDAGFDRVLVAHSSASPDGFTVADQVYPARSGSGAAGAPTGSSPDLRGAEVRTRTPSTRVALHVSGGDDADQARTGT